MRKQRTKFTESQINYIYEELEKGNSINNIAKILSVYPQVIQTFCKNNDLTSKAYQFWTSEEDEILKQMYISEDYSMNDIIKKLNKSKDAIQCRAKTLKIKRPFLLSDEEKCFIDENYKTMQVTAIARKLKRKLDTVKRYMDSMNYESMDSRLEQELNENEKFKNDFHNPQLSGAYIARLYGFNDSYIISQRKKRIGNFKQMTNTFLCKSVAEIDFEEILEELNMTFLYEYKINKWKVDYYLGFNVVVEIQGTYWHSLEKVKEKDKRKFEDLKNLNYIVIEIQEEELKNKDLVKEKIMQIYKRAVLG